MLRFKSTVIVTITTTTIAIAIATDRPVHVTHHVDFSMHTYHTYHTLHNNSVSPRALPLLVRVLDDHQDVVLVRGDHDLLLLRPHAQEG